MGKIIQALHLIHDYVQKDENGNIESKNRVLRDISVDIESGSFVVLLGHNGSGKSTLARHLNALLQPTEGTVWIDGHDTKNQQEWLEIRKTAGMVFQNPDNQIIASVVEEDVAFGPENMGVPTEEIWQRVAKSLESCLLYTSYSARKVLVEVDGTQSMDKVFEDIMKILGE